MKSIDRRLFLRYAIQSAAALGLESTVLGRLQSAYAAGASGLPTVLWLAGGACTGCTVSLANRVSASHPTDVGDLVLVTGTVAIDQDFGVGYQYAVILQDAELTLE